MAQSALSITAPLGLAVTVDVFGVCGAIAALVVGMAAAPLRAAVATDQPVVGIATPHLTVICTPAAPLAFVCSAGVLAGVEAGSNERLTAMTAQAGLARHVKAPGSIRSWIFDQERSLEKPEPQAGLYVETDIEFSYRLPADIFFPGGHLLSRWNWSPFRPTLTVSYQQSVLLRIALERLRHDKNVTIKEIALSLGYSSSADFARFIRSKAGACPSKFRRPRGSHVP